MKAPSKLTIPILLALICLLLISAAFLYSSEYKALVLPIAGITLLLGILVFATKLKAKEYATIASAPQKAKELVASTESYKLHASLKTKSGLLFGGILIPPMVIYFLHKELGFQLLWGQSHFGWSILGCGISVILFLYFVLKSPIMHSQPIVEINSHGITHFQTGTIPWEKIAEISLWVKLTNSYYYSSFGPVRVPVKIRTFFLQLNVHNIDRFKAESKNMKNIHSLIVKNGKLNLALLTDEYNANVVVEFAKAFAIKTKAPLTERSNNEAEADLSNKPPRTQAQN